MLFILKTLGRIVIGKRALAYVFFATIAASSTAQEATFTTGFAKEINPGLIDGG